MQGTASYADKFLSLSNPLLFGLLIAFIVAVVIVLFFMKILLPVQRAGILEKQKHLLETAELMALFSEMDPDPQLRINKTGEIIQTNLAARNVFKGIEKKGKEIADLLPALKPDEYFSEKHFITTISGAIYSIDIKPGADFDFTNIYLHDITVQKNNEKALEDYKDKLKELADRLDGTIEGMKKTVSQELHDDIGHSLMALKLKASMDDINSGEILKGITTVYEKVRELSRELRPADIGRLGLALSIQNLVETMSRGAGIKGTFEFDGGEINLADEIALCLYRVTQEALMNIVKHSKADEFTVALKADNDTADLIIIDNGRGIPEKYFDPKNYKQFGLGLFNMKERVEKFKGTFKINSNSETGTVIIIQIPIAEENYERD